MMKLSTNNRRSCAASHRVENVLEHFEAISTIFIELIKLLKSKHSDPTDLCDFAEFWRKPFEMQLIKKRYKKNELNRTKNAWAGEWWQNKFADS